MKFKRMMAVLLAASMVVSSTGVGVLADEFTFDDGIVVEDVVVEDAGFEVEEPVVEEDVYVEEPVVEDVAFEEEPAYEEGVQDILDIVDAASEEANYSDYFVADAGYDGEYDGQEHSVLTEKLNDLTAPYTFAKSTSKDTAPTTGWTSENPKYKNYMGEDYEYVWVKGANYDGTKTGDKFKGLAVVGFKITKAPVTVTLNDKTFKYADLIGESGNTTLKMSDFTVTGLKNGEEASKVLELTDITWATLKDSDNKTLSGEDVGKYFIPLEDVTVDNKDATAANYKFTKNGGYVTVEPSDATVKWSDLTFPYDGNYHRPKATWDSPKIYGDYIIKFNTFDEEKKVGNYTAKITKITINGKDCTKDFNLTNAETAWSITKAKVIVDSTSLTNTIFFGSEEPFKGMSTTNLKYLAMDPSTGQWTVNVTAVALAATGTPVFTTNYERYADVNVYKDGTAIPGAKSYYIRYASGLTSDNYEIITSEAKDGKLKVKPVPVVVDTVGTVVKYGDPAAEITNNYKISNGKEGSVTVLWSAEALQRDIDSKRIKATVFTDPQNPSGIGKYKMYVSLTDKDETTKALMNYTVLKPQDGKTVISGDNLKKIEGIEEYTVTTIDVDFKISDNKVRYDGQKHGLVIDPAPDYKLVKIYYATTEAPTTIGASAKYGAKDPTTFINYTKTSTIEPTRTEVGKTNVYFLVTANDSQSPEASVIAWGMRTIEVVEADQYDADAVGKQIDEATKKDSAGNYDEAKVKAAREAYEALNDKAKSKVPLTKVRKLEDAEKEIASKTDAEKAKAVENMIDALPAADKVTADDAANIKQAKEAYDALTDAQKKLVPAEKVAKLEADVKAAEEAEKAAAKKVAEQIEDLPTPSDIKLSDKDAVEAAKKAYDALPDDQKALVPVEDKEKLLAAERAIEELEAADKKAAEEAKAAEDKVAAIKDAEPGQGKAATEAAREAFDALSMTAREKVSPEAIEALVQAEKCYAKDTVFEAGEGVYRVLSNGEVTYIRPLHPEATYFQVPNDVRCPEGYSFKVVKVSVNAFKGCGNVKKIWMGKNIVTIGKYAFKGAVNLKTLIVRTQDIDVEEKIENAFAGAAKNSNGKLNVQVWEKMISKYEPMFRGAGKLPKNAKFTTID